jgi:hypothetical protein
MPGGGLGVRVCAGRDVLLVEAGFCFLRSSISKKKSDGGSEIGVIRIRKKDLTKFIVT